MEAAGRRDDWDVIFIAEQKKVSGLNGCQKALDMAPSVDHRTPYYIVRSRRSSCRSYQNAGWPRAQEVPQRTRNRGFLFHGREDEVGAGAQALQALLHGVLK